MLTSDIRHKRVRRRDALDVEQPMSCLQGDSGRRLGDMDVMSATALGGMRGKKEDEKEYLGQGVSGRKDLRSPDLFW